MGEVLRHLIESGGVRFVDGRWVVPDPDQIDVPEGVRDVIGQRLSMLSDVTNEVLRAASVVGREFDLDLVGELAGIDEDPLLDAIDDATRARLVEEVDADRFRFAPRAWSVRRSTTSCRPVVAVGCTGASPT